MAENNSVSPNEDELGSLGNIVAETADKIKYLVLAVLVVLIAAAALVGYMRKSAAQREAAAKDKVFETVATIQNEATPPAEVAQLFANAAKEYAGLDAGAQAAAMRFAYTYNENKDYAAAEQAAKDFIATYPNSPMLHRARLALGQSLLQQDKVDDAIAVFREATAANDPETLPEAKLALAQALERRAAQVKDNEAEYRSRLMEAEAEYTDIITRAQISVPSQRGFWHQAVTLPADYALVQLKDRLAGHVHGTPTLPVEDPAAPAGGILSVPPPPSGGINDAGSDEAVSAAVAAVVEAVKAAEEAPAMPAAPAAETVENIAPEEAPAVVSAPPPAAAPATETAAEAEETVEAVAAPDAPAAAPEAEEEEEEAPAAAPEAPAADAAVETESSAKAGEVADASENK